MKRKITDKQWLQNQIQFEINSYESRKLQEEKIKREQKQKKANKIIWIYILFVCAFVLGAWVMYKDMRTDFIQSCVFNSHLPTEYCKEAFTTTFGGI